MSGLDRLLGAGTFPHPGARAGFLGHHASVDRQGRHAVDLLRERGEWRILKLFSPEHGFFGKAAAGENVGDSIHPKWNLPVYSLYGEHRAPPPEWLDGLDLMVTDLQDLGVRCYTYASTLLLMLRACADAGLPVLVLDRATPLAGIVDGPPLDPDLRCFVGMIDLPLVFGKGQGDLALHLKRTDSGLRNLDLEVFRDSENESGSDEEPREWIPPSPAIVSREAALLYPVTVWSEAVAEVEVDRGGADSFGIWTQQDFPEALRREPPTFRGMSACPVSRKWPGWKFTVEDPHAYRPVENALRMLCALRDHLGNERLFTQTGARPEFFDQLMGTGTVRRAILAGASAEDIVSSWS